MPPSYSAKLVDAVLPTDDMRLGVQLARACVQANLPAAYVAQVLGVSRMSIHRWFRGHPIRSKKVQKINVFMQLLEEDTVKGVLPAKTIEGARIYLQDMVDEPIKMQSSKKAG
jgi:hypothetical protein